MGSKGFFYVSDRSSNLCYRPISSNPTEDDMYHPSNPRPLPMGDELKELSELPHPAKALVEQNKLHDKLPQLFQAGARNQFFFHIEDIKLPPPRTWRS